MQEPATQARLWKIITIAEVATVSTLIMFQIWVLQKQHHSWAAYIAAALIVGGWIVRKETPKTLGLLNNSTAAVVALGFAIKIFFGHSLSSHASGTTSRILLHFVSYLPWAAVQQVVLNGFFVKRLNSVIEKKYVPALAALIFGGVHYPNHMLVPVTATGGAVISYWFLRIKKTNLYFLCWVIVAHAAIGILILYLFPWSWHHNMTVGAKYYR